MIHHQGDGCHGENRHLDKEDQQAIAVAMGHMMMSVARQDGPGLLHHGAWIGVHYGPDGEWALALRLATQILGLAPLEECNDTGVPQVAKALSADDVTLQLMMAHCVSQFPAARDHTRQELRQALEDTMPLAEQFLDHYKHDRKVEAYAAWERMYECSDTSRETTRESILRGGASSALLACWAAHYSVQRLDA